MDRQVIVRVSQVRVATVVRVAREVMEVGDTVQVMVDMVVVDQVMPRLVKAMEDMSVGKPRQRMYPPVDSDHPRVVSQKDVDVKVRSVLAVERPLLLP